jgi:hypothetical protein
MIMKESAFINNKKMAIFIMVVLLIIYRSPELFVHPRFWAEEATIYFRYAYESSVLDGLLMIAGDSAGYLLLLGNIAITLATLVPLEYAPFVTTYFSFIIFIVPFIIILWGSSYVWDIPIKKVLAILIVLFSPAASIPEIWLNTINSQIYCGIAALCILFEKNTINTKQAIFYRIVLLLGGLNGIYITFLILPFFIKLWVERNKNAAWYFGIVFLVALIQFSLFLLLKLSGENIADKASHFDLLRVFTRVFYYHVATPLLGINILEFFTLKLTNGLTIENILTTEKLSYFTLLVLNIFSLVFIILFLIYIAKLNSSIWQRWLFLTAFIISSLLITFAALHGAPANRYLVIPGVILSFFMLSNITLSKPTNISTIFLLGSIGIGIFNFKCSANEAFFKYSSTSANWVDEVKAWEKNKNYHLKIWPEHWTTAFSVDRNKVIQFDYLLRKSAPMLFDLSQSNAQWQEGNIIFPIDSLLSNFMIGITLTAHNFDQQYTGQLFLVKILFLETDHKICLDYETSLPLNLKQPIYLVPAHYINSTYYSVIKLPSIKNDCTYDYRKVQQIQFLVKPINKVPVTLEMNFHVGNTKKYSIFRLF